MFESPETHNPQESFPDRHEGLKEGFGIVLCSKTKEGNVVSLERQIAVAQEMGLVAVQFDFRNRSIEDINALEETLVSYKKLNPEASISIHGETPRIDEVSLDFKDKERTLRELELLRNLSGEAYTVHPPSISSKILHELSGEIQETIFQNYAHMFAVATRATFDAGKSFSICVENMPAKGEDGSWGQSSEDMLFLIKKIEQAIIDEGLDPEIARTYVGVTFDVNHALHGVDKENYQKILYNWMEALGEYVRVVHLYTPSKPDEAFTEKYKMVLDLVARFNPNARLFMESKQNEETTEELYRLAKEID